ncbi:type II toxin-antitoxin system VapB family antitoxin [Sphingomonas profundi]|uniref:type II toxin-antitoxin system VapB family antitoxin n=1 Tax=Alterirhizorhabdus profundi TaxID=2681549 RepID=UPI0018D08901|nr:type II toxin-antitoxin system VapB family antitoxin [Sphingomonas profundi]
MALSIKDEELDRKVRRLAALRKTSFTGAIRLAVDNELAREAVDPEREARRVRAEAAVKAAQEWFRAGPVDWSMTDDEILGYDENGVPTQPE